MATIFRDLSYRYQWLYDGISRLAAVTVGGEPRFRQLALQNLKLQSDFRPHGARARGLRRPRVADRPQRPTV